MTHAQSLSDLLQSKSQSMGPDFCKSVSVTTLKRELNPSINQPKGPTLARDWANPSLLTSFGILGCMLSELLALGQHHPMVFFQRLLWFVHSEPEAPRVQLQLFPQSLDQKTGKVGNFDEWF